MHQATEIHPSSDNDAVPKLTGADVELGNFIAGDNPGSDSDFEAARALLREIPGFTRVPASSTWNPDPGHDWEYPSSRGNVYRAHGYVQNAQDWGRKFLPSNGGCVYIDLSHLEVCIPECLDAFTHVAAFHAMLRIVRDAQVRANERLGEGRSIKVLVNNTDGRNSWGAHLNVLVSRRCYDNLFSRKMHQLQFLASYQASSIILTGGGTVTMPDRDSPGHLEISSRAGFYQSLVGAQTTCNRPLVNARDEGLVGGASRQGSLDHRLARVHVIFYDASLSQVATVLKVGMTQIVLAMVEQGRVPGQLLLDDPLEAVQAWSRDPDLRVKARLVGGGHVTAAEHLQGVFEQARRFVESGRADGIVERAADIISLWGRTLEMVRKRDFAGLSACCDWAAKKCLLERVIQQRGLSWESPQIRHLDQVYSSLDPAEGLHWACLSAGGVERVVTDGDIERLTLQPPENTRAWLRAHVLRRAEEIGLDDVDWDKIVIRREDQRFISWTSYTYPTLILGDPLGFTQRDCQGLLSESPSLLNALTELGMTDGDTASTRTYRDYATATALGSDVVAGTSAIVPVAGSNVMQ